MVHIFSPRFVNPVLLNTCVSSAVAAEHFSSSFSSQTMLSKLEQFLKFISGLAEHNMSHFHSDTSRCLALLHQQLKLLF